MLPSTESPEWWYVTELLSEYLRESSFSIWPHVIIKTGPERGFFPWLDVQKGTNITQEEWGDDFNYVARLLSNLKDTISAFLENIYYLGPMRKAPQRFYRLNTLPEEDEVERTLATFRRFAVNQITSSDNIFRSYVNNTLATLGFNLDVNI